MIKQQRANFILQRLNQLYPETPVPLNHRNNFELLVAVLLSAQCTDERVNQVTPALFALADNPAAMAALEVEQIQQIIRPCGLSPQKSRAIKRLSEILVQEHNGQVPAAMEALERLHIERVLASSDSLDAAARTLGIDASTLYRKRKLYGF